MESRSLIRSFLASLCACLFLSLLAACGPGQAPEPTQQTAEEKKQEAPARPRTPRTVRVTVPQGTEIRLALDTQISSASSQAGDTFTARTTDPVVVGDRVAIPSGSTIHGQVSQVVPARKGLKEKEGSITLSFDKVVTPSGFSAPMSAGIASIAPKSGKKTAGIIGGSAAGGAILGKILGGSTKDAAVGAVVGGAIGTGIAAGTKGEDAMIPAGSTLTIALDQPLTIAVKP